MIKRPSWPPQAAAFGLRLRLEYPSSLGALVRAAPFVLLCVAVSWAFTFILAKPDYGYESRLVFHVPDITSDAWNAISSLFTAPLLNRGPQQVLYVTILLLMFGVMVESREGSRRTLLIFFSSAGSGALFAALLLHILYPGLSTHPALAEAWTGAWSGGSAGAFGLAGAFAARQHRPWPWMLAIIIWEANVAVLHLRNYTPVFHLAALVAGFLVTRYLLPPRERPTDLLDRASTPV